MQKLKIVPKYKNDANLFKYALGYKNAVIKLLEEGFSNSKYRIIDFYLPYPILYLFRHFVELQLKEIIVIYSEYNEGKKHEKIHDLKILWNKVKLILEEIFYHKPNKHIQLHRNNFKILEEIILDLHKYDKDSTVFRYPTDKFGSISIQSEIQIFVDDLKEKVNYTFDLMEFISNRIIIHYEDK